MNDRPSPTLAHRVDDRVLDLASAGAARHFEHLTFEMRKWTRQSRFNGVYPRTRNHLIIDTGQPPVAVQRIRNRECITQRGNVGVDKTSPDDDRTDRQLTASNDVLRDKPWTLIAEDDRRSIDWIDNGVALEINSRGIIRACAREKRLRPYGVVAARREAAGVAHRQISARRSPEHAVIDAVISGPRYIGDADGAVFE